MTQPPANYRTNARPLGLAELADRGRSLRTRAGFDPHALVAPNAPTDPRATLLEQLAASTDEAFDQALASPWTSPRMRGRFALMQAGAPAALVFGLLVVASLVLVCGFAMLADAYGRWIVLLAPLTVVAVAVAAALFARARNQPRRWLARNPLRAEGYLELLGRESRVVRLRALVHFARGAAAPDLELFKDVLTGADVRTQGVLLAAPGVIAVHSPELNGARALLHGWFQALCDRALVPVDASYSIAHVAVEER